MNRILKRKSGHNVAEAEKVKDRYDEPKPESRLALNHSYARAPVDAKSKTFQGKKTKGMEVINVTNNKFLNGYRVGETKSDTSRKYLDGDLSRNELLDNSGNALRSVRSRSPLDDYVFKA